MANIHLHHLYINNKNQIGLKYNQSKVITAIIKCWQTANWSDTHNMYFVPNNKQNLSLIYADFKGIAWINGQHFYNQKRKVDKIESIVCYKSLVANIELGICPEEYLNKLIVLNYALNTCKTYVSLFKKFLYAHKNIAINEIDEILINEYLQNLAKNNASKSLLNQTINAIKFYFEVVLEMPNRFYKINRPRKSVSLPKVISKDNVFEIIKNCTNTKHKAMLALLYSSGIRRSELLNLKIEDIDSKRMLIFIKDSKGNKDRYVPLSKFALMYLRKYYIEWKPKLYLFEGQTKDQYSASSLNKLIKTAAKKAKIKQVVSAHTFRHSFATHLLEEGTDLRMIQAILGHGSSKTTEIYTHVAKTHLNMVKNPFDTGILDYIKQK